jgi:hypothetical protein
MLLMMHQLGVRILFRFNIKKMILDKISRNSALKS